MQRSHRRPAEDAAEVASATPASREEAVSNAAMQEALQDEELSSTPTLDLLDADQEKPSEKFSAKKAKSRRRKKPAKPKAPAAQNLQVSQNPGLSTSDANSYNYQAHNGSAFIQGEGDAAAIDQEDVSQGSLGDCYWMAGMAAVAQAAPQAIQNAIKDNGDGTYDVTLYKNGKPVTIKVDNKFPSRSGGGLAYAEYGDQKDGLAELWPAILEKAWAIFNDDKKNGYEEIEGGLPGDAVETLTGRASTDYDPRSTSAKTILSVVSAALENKNPVTCATLGDSDVTPELKKDFDSYGFYANHCYTFYAVDVQGETVTLRNPWGSSHPKALPIAVFKKCFDTLSINKMAK